MPDASGVDASEVPASGVPRRVPDKSWTFLGVEHHFPKRQRESGDNRPMARPLRRFMPDEYQFISIRCLEERFFLSPSAAVNLLLANWLRLALRLYGVQLFAFVAMSNHLHMVIRAPLGGLPAMMQYFLSNVARGINRLRGRHGYFWSGRYHAQPILDLAAFRDRVGYTLANPVNAGLVPHATDWKGLTSAAALEFHARNVADDLSDQSDPGIPLDVPDWADELYWVEQRRDLDERCARADVGIPAALITDHNYRPQAPKRGRQPLCFASIASIREEFKLAWKAFRAAYRIASIAYRAGDHSVEFPEGSFRPWVPS